MFYIVKFLESLIFPPGIFIVFLLLIGIFFFRQSRALATTLLITALTLYAVSTSVVAYALIRPLESCYTPPTDPKGDVLIMLGGGVTFGTPALLGQGNLTGDGANRLFTTAMLYQKTHLLILLTGGPIEGNSSESIVAKSGLVALGVPENKILTENNSLNTLQNAAYSKPILQSHGFSHPILITSAYHMRRAILDFNRTGISATPYPCGYFANRGTGLKYDSLLPSTASLSITGTALHEYVGILATKIGIGG